MASLWKIPQRHPLKTREECKVLLALGFTLINNYGYRVALDTKGKQIISNPNRNNSYDFTHPHYWQVLDSASTDRTKILDTNNMWFRFELWLLKLAIKMF